MDELVSVQVWARACTTGVYTVLRATAAEASVASTSMASTVAPYSGGSMADVQRIAHAAPGGGGICTGNT
jgi:hypothetical protein